MLLVEYSVFNDKPVVHIFTRDGKKRVHKRVKDFEPYFYVKEDEPLPRSKRIVRVEKGFKSIYGEKVKKIIVRLPKDVRDLRDKFTKTFESDILFNNRFTFNLLSEVGEVVYFPRNKDSITWKELKDVNRKIKEGILDKKGFVLVYGEDK